MAWLDLRTEIALEMRELTLREHEVQMGLERLAAIEIADLRKRQAKYQRTPKGREVRARAAGKWWRERGAGDAELREKKRLSQQRRRARLRAAGRKVT